MLALRLEYLTGRAVVTAYNDRNQTEWPPHPARVFSALVATWAEHELIDPDEATHEREALEWLERLPPPAIACGEVCARSVVTHFVPTNDVSVFSNQDWNIVARLVDETEELSMLQQGDSESSRRKSATKRKDAAAKRERTRAALARSQERLSARLAEVPSRFNATDLNNAIALFPEFRVRQPRTFPSIALADPVVHFIWNDTPGSHHEAALARLASRLVRIGHSSSLVHARWVDQAPHPAWVPDEVGELLLRIAGPGQLERLHAEFDRHQGVEPRVLPFRAQRYRSNRRAEASATRNTRHFDAHDWIILKRIGGPVVTLTRTVDVASAVRGALLRHAEAPATGVLSGHAENGEPSRAPHLVIQPLPHVGHRHADGRIMGIALILPRSCESSARHALLRAIGRWEGQAREQKGHADDEAPILTLGLGDGVEMEVQRHVWGEPGSAALRTTAWCAGSAEWMSVTPVALDRNPGDLASADAEKRDGAYKAAAESIARACGNFGLPLPVSISILPSGTWPGGAKASQFPVFPREAGKLRRVQVHARLHFSEPVEGPVILGAGRFLGLGLFKPVPLESA